MPSNREIAGIGIDLVSWKRIERLIREHSLESLKRILAPSEQTAFQNASHPAEFLARCFTAKEAFFKARGGSWMGEENFREMEVVMKGRERFSVHSNGVRTEGRFFKSPDGIGAQVLLWKRRNF